jgi:GTPase SAR1 family protein
VVLLFLDLSSKKSVDIADVWFTEAKDSNIDCPIIVVGSKSDTKKVNL